MAKSRENEESKVWSVIHVDTESALPAMIWICGWLFSIGYAKLGFWSGLWALIVWPYYIGSRLSM